MAAFRNTLEDWERRLEEINEELGLMVGRPGFSVAGLSTNEEGNFNRLTMMKVEAESKIEALGGGTAGSRNVRVVGGDSSW